MKKILFILLLFISCNPPTEKNEESLKGKVVSVADGDTVTIITDNNERVRIRLYGIDAPEKGQDFANKSREYLNDLCYGKRVSIDKKGVDQYNRVLGVIYIGDLNLNQEMVRTGLAWYYDYFVKDPHMEELEQIARQKKLNIWSMKNPIPPYEYRKSQRNNKNRNEE